MQLQTLTYARSGTNLFSVTYGYTQNGGNNGQITGITDSVDGTRSTTIVYDAWNRVKSWSNAQAAITETYDRYGNRLTQSLPVPSNVAVDTNTNHITTAGYAYDAAGNMTNDSINVLTYDGENRVVTSTQSGATYTYAYDGNGLRVEKTPPAGSATVYIFSGSKVIAEYAAGAAAGSPSTEYIYSGLQLVATISGSSTTYQHPDHLSARVSTDASGNTVRTFGHYPFGEVWYETGTASKWKFTSYERDSESLNDYAIARIYATRQGRFLSPDQLGGWLFNPQSLNRYAYVLNNPISFTDPTGLSCYWDDGTHDDTPEEGGADQVTCGEQGGTWIDPFSDSITVSADPLPSDGGVGQWLSDWWDSFTAMDWRQISVQLNQCAATNANKLYSKVLGDNKVANAVLGNGFAALSQLALGPDRKEGAIGVAADPHGGGALAVQGVGRAVGQIPVLRGTNFAPVPGTDIQLGGQQRFATMIDRYVAVRVKDLPAFSKVIGQVESVLDGKLLLDGATYLSMEISCTMP